VWGVPPLSWRRVAYLLAPMLAVFAMVLRAAPLPANLAGTTHCLPVVGPFVQIDGSLEPKDRTLTLAHEEAHELQCWRQGFVTNFVTRLSPDGRLHAELEAFCAEGRTELALGRRADLVVERILDELEEGYAAFRGTHRRTFLRRFGRICPDVVGRTQQPVG
jgi:hypothetical protein